MDGLVTYVINFEDAQGRLQATTLALSKLGLTFSRVPAMDYRRTSVHDLEMYNHAGALNQMGRTLTGGELGCFQSQLRALELFLQSGEPYALILEDDITPSNNAREMLVQLVSWQTNRCLDDWAVVNLGASRRHMASSLAELSDGHSLVVVKRAHYFPLRTTALLWTREGAQQFIADHKTIDCPVDHALRRWAMRGDRGLSVAPSLFDTSNAESQIDARAGKRSAVGRQKLYHLRRLRRQLVKKKWLFRRSCETVFPRRQDNHHDQPTCRP